MIPRWQLHRLAEIDVLRLRPMDARIISFDEQDRVGDTVRDIAQTRRFAGFEGGALSGHEDIVGLAGELHFSRRVLEYFEPGLTDGVVLGAVPRLRQIELIVKSLLFQIR